MMETTKGLPNNCSQCGTPILETWFSRNLDEARSGKGFCADCIAAEAPAVQEPLPDFLQPKDNLTVISGLGSASAKKLEAVGVTTFAQLGLSDAGLTAGATGINEAKLQDWIEAAQDMA